MEFLTVEPDDILEMAMRLATELREAGFVPDVLVTILRGGMVIARYMSDFLDVRDIRSIRVEHYSALEKKEGARIVEPLRQRLDGKKVLIVDDVADTGESLAEAIKHVKEMGASEIKVATLHYKPWSKVTPDFFCQETQSWVIYPWEYAETARFLLKTLTTEEGMSREEALQVILNDAKIPERVIRWLGLLREEPSKE